jgi:hypothetical protein
MKIITTFFSIALFISCANSKETNYTASTPAGSVVRTFLGISLADSIDFIRWKLSLTDLRYTVECTYGIGKPNTNGFYDPKTVKLSATVKRDNATNTYTLQNGNTTLKLAELNANLLHVLNNDNSLAIGNGGWSYALNNITPATNGKSLLSSKQIVIKDSMAFEGRTPCGVPGIVEKGNQCYKLKWLFIFYGNSAKNEPATYKLLGTPYRVEGGRRGNWKIITGKDGRIIYQLFDENSKPFIHLLKLDEGVLIFTDEKENLLVGDLDFSYTLNRRF